MAIYTYVQTQHQPGNVDYPFRHFVLKFTGLSRYNPLPIDPYSLNTRTELEEVLEQESGRFTRVFRDVLPPGVKPFEEVSAILGTIVSTITRVPIDNVA